MRPRKVLAGFLWGCAAIAAGLLSSDWSSWRALVYLTACVGFAVMAAVTSWGKGWLPMRFQRCPRCGQWLYNGACWNCDTPT
jgi:hypothetical protein